MNCINLVKRKNKPYCKNYNEEIDFSKCFHCLHKEYKKTTPPIYKERKPIKQKTNKQAKMEKERYSIITDDLKHCVECGKSPVSKHEIFYGSGKRHLSIKYGLVISLCTCEHHNQVESKGIHFDIKLCDKWHKIGQKAYMKYYKKTKDEFRMVFGKNYL